MCVCVSEGERVCVWVYTQMYTKVYNNWCSCMCVCYHPQQHPKHKNTPCTFWAPATPVKSDNPARLTNEAICLHADAIEEITVASSLSIRPLASSLSNHVVRVKVSYSVGASLLLEVEGALTSVAAAWACTCTLLRLLRTCVCCRCGDGGDGVRR